MHVLLKTRELLTEAIFLFIAAKENLLPKYTNIYIYLYVYIELSPKWKNFHEHKVFFFRFYILCENFSKIGPIIDDPLKNLLSHMPVLYFSDNRRLQCFHEQGNYPILG